MQIKEVIKMTHKLRQEVIKINNLDNVNVERISYIYLF